MENTERDTAYNAAPLNDWRNAETNSENRDFSDADAPRYVEESFDERTSFAANLDELYPSGAEINQPIVEAPGALGIDPRTAEPAPNKTDEPIDSPIYASSNSDPDPDDEDESDDEEEEEDGDWGHVDPAEGNSPFPDSNDPSGPGSAV